MKQTPKFPVWDIPTRLFHWLLAMGFAAAWLTYKTNKMELHSWIGYGLLTLLLFRLVWGVIGSPHSRFGDFVHGPGTVLSYIKGDLSPTPGHNPLGGWSVVVLLTLLVIQAVTGLFNGDDILFDGPFRAAVDSSLADSLGALHGKLFYVIVGLVCLHVVAVCWHQWAKKEQILHAMISGHKKNISGKNKPAPLWRAIVALLVCAGLIWWVISLAPEPEFFY